MFLLDKNFLPTPVEGKVDPLSLDALISWLEAKPSDQEYPFQDTSSRCGGCLFSQYAAHIGYSRDFEGYAKYLEDMGTFPHDPFERISGGGEYTFGAALDRARKIRSAQ